VRIRITFGGFGSCLFSLFVSSTKGKQAVSVKQPASSKRKSKVIAPAILSRMAGLSVWFALVEGLPKSAYWPPVLVAKVELARLQSTPRHSQDVPYAVFCACSWGVEDATFSRSCTDSFPRNPFGRPS
jgi:hypothetical protein